MKYAIEIDLNNFTEEEILNLAKYRGYKTEVAKIVEEDVLDDNGNKIGVRSVTETVDNPQSPDAYLAEKGEEYVSNWLSERLVKEIKRQGRETINQNIKATKEQISTCLTISKVEE